MKNIFASLLLLVALYSKAQQQQAELCDRSASSMIGQLVANGGFMYDVKALKDISVRSVGFFSRYGNGSYSVYTKQGTHIGTELDSTQWALISTLYVPAVTGADSLITAELPVPYTIDSGDVVSYAVFSPNTYLVYTSGGSVNDPSYSDTRLEVYPGTGFKGVFATSYYPRFWNGVLQVCADEVLGIEQAGLPEVALYPNPTNDILNVTTDEHEPVTLDATDMQGRMVMTVSFLASATLDVAQLPASVYQLYLHNANGTAVKRFVKN